MQQIPRRIKKIDGDEENRRANEASQIDDARRSYRAQQSRFSRYFGQRLSGEQITAAEKLLIAMETAIKAGNATPNYDGVSITGLTYGPKDGLADHVIYALEKIRECRKRCADSLGAYDYARTLFDALLNDRTPQEVGDLLVGIRAGQKRRRDIAFSIIGTATQLIVPVFNKRQGAV